VGLEANRTYSFIGSSLLFIHDGTGLKRQRRPRIRMIDFAHVHTADQDTAEPADPGYITGLQTLIRCDGWLQQRRFMRQGLGFRRRSRSKYLGNTEGLRLGTPEQLAPNRERICECGGWLVLTARWRWCGEPRRSSQKTWRTR
jgi:hypothetical protein